MYVFQQAAYSPVKSSQVVLPSPQKADIPATRTAFIKPVSSPQKSSMQGTAFPSSPKKGEPPSSTSVPQSLLKNQALSRGPNPNSSPQKPELCPKEKAIAGAPGGSCCNKIEFFRCAVSYWKCIMLYCKMLGVMLYYTKGTWQFSLSSYVNKNTFSCVDHRSIVFIQTCTRSTCVPFVVFSYDLAFLENYKLYLYYLFIIRIINDPQFYLLIPNLDFNHMHTTLRLQLDLFGVWCCCWCPPHV